MSATPESPDVLISKEFDDVYFSRQDGLAETRHVFIDGNDLPQAWLGRESFHIAELGFGTGLNIVEAASLFSRTAEAGQHLYVTSLEKYPLSAGVIKDALSQWRGEIGEGLDELLAVYPAEPAGDVRLKLNACVSLRILFMDVHEALSLMAADNEFGVIDAWFLDGFKPSSNPQMWDEAVLQALAGLSREGTSFATFTAAGFVRRGLQAAGFAVEKRPGFGRKREMIAGHYRGGNRLES